MPPKGDFSIVVVTCPSCAGLATRRPAKTLVVRKVTETHRVLSLASALAPALRFAA